MINFNDKNKTNIRMNKISFFSSGFTLIEIIGVIIILGLLVLIVVPFFTRSLNVFRDDYYENMVNTLTTSGKEFFEDNSKLLPVETLATQKVLISTLESEKYIDEVKDYNNESCSSESFVRVINEGKDNYKYVACIICNKDNFDTISINDECNTWWDSDSDIESVTGEPNPIYVYKGTKREVLEEKTKIKADLVKKDSSGRIVSRVVGEGESKYDLMPINLDTIDTNKVGDYTLEYLNGSKTFERKLHVYENDPPKVTFEKVENDGLFSTNKSVIDLTPGKTEWAKALVTTIAINEEGKGPFYYSLTGTKVSVYQWNKGGRWKDFCVPVDGKTCIVKTSEEVDREKVRFRAIDNEGNISIETSEYEIRIDHTNPKCEFKVEGEINSSGIYITPTVISFKTHKDQGSVQSGVKSYGFGSVNGSKTQNHDKDTLTGKKYTGYIVDYADNSSTCSITIKQKKTYLLTYNNNSGSDCTSKNIIYSKAYGDLCSPTRTGYTFAGWYTSASGGTLVTKNTILDKDEDRTIYAHWTPNTYTIAFNGNGNTGGATTSQTCTIDVNCVLNANGFSRTDYMFTGWATSSDGEVSYDNSATVKNIASGGGSITLYAKWISTVTYFSPKEEIQPFTPQISGRYLIEVCGAQGQSGGATGGKGGYAAGIKYLSAGTTVYVAVGSSSGYNGGGIGKNGGGNGGGATHVTTTNRGLLSNYNSYRSEILLVGGGGGGGCSENEKLTGGAGGGSSGENGNGDDYGIGGNQQRAGSRSTGCCGSSSGSFGKGGDAPNHAGENIGAGGAGYFGGSGGTGEYHNGSGGGGSGYIGGVSSGMMITGYCSNDGYAKITYWNGSIYTISYDDNGGSGCSGQTRSVFTSFVYGELCTPTRAEHNFLGWYTKNSGGVKITERTPVTATSDHTLYAHWEYVGSPGGGCDCDPPCKNQYNGWNIC